MPRPESGARGATSQGRPFRPVWFVVGFVAIYAALHALYFTVPDHLLREGLHYYGIVAPGAQLDPAGTGCAAGAPSPPLG